MKRFVGFYYRCSLNACLWAFLSLIGLLLLPSTAFALQSGDFTYTKSGGIITITKYTGTGGNVVAPDAIDGNPVLHIGDSAFAYCIDLTSVTIPSSVTSIGDSAFYHCSGLTSVTIPGSVTSIGDYAFADCSGLTSVTIPGSVTSIGVEAFSGCSGLTSVTIPDSVTSIGDYAFSGCSSLTIIAVDANNTVYSSQDGVLCNKNRTVLIQYPVGKYGGFTIPGSVTIIGDSAFYHCSGLTSVTIPGSVTSIGVEAFSGCSGLTSVTIPDSVTSIGDYAFSGCSSLTIIAVDANNTVYSSQDGVLCNKNRTVLIQYPVGKYGGVHHSQQRYEHWS